MGETTHISWADHTHNHWLGCTKVSNGPFGACEGCYAKVLVEDRFGRAEFGGPGRGVGTRALTSEANRRKPLAWDRKAAKDGTRPFVFCSSLADVFDSDVPPEWRADLFDLIRRTPHLVWLLLTKRPGNIVKLYKEACLDSCRWLGEPWPSNAAIGCTVVTQAEADRDVPKLLTAKATLKPAFTFLSMEPLLGPVDLTCLRCSPGYETDVLIGEVRASAFFRGIPSPAEIAARAVDVHPIEKLDWIITGGETDQGLHKARPSHPDWFRFIRDQCAAAGVAYHHKQNGEWGPIEGWYADHPVSLPLRVWDGVGWTDDGGLTGEWVAKCGKRQAGRSLDGVVHDARPGGRAGTADMVRQARAAGVEVREVEG